VTTGSSFEDKRFTLSGVYGTVGPTYLKSWSGVDTPRPGDFKPPKAETQPFSTYYTRKDAEWAHVVQKHRFARFDPRRFPPKRARTQENPYAMNATNRKSVVYQDPVTHSFYSSDGAGYHITGVLGDATVANLVAIGRLREQLAGSDFNLGVTLGESREAFKLITDSATRIYKAYKAVRRGNVQAAKTYLTGNLQNRHITVRPVARPPKGVNVVEGLRELSASKSKYLLNPKDLAQNWLELQYGWMPLLKDVENAAQFLAHHYNVPLQKVVRVSARTRFGTTSNSTSPTNVIAAEVEALERVYIKAILREKNIAMLAGLSDPLSVAWELTPYSFVADWFIPIGNWLQARALSSAIEGTFVTSVKRYSQVNGWKSLNLVNQPDVADYFSRVSDFSRTVSSTLPVPLPRFKSLEKVASVKHCLNAVALLIGNAGSGSIRR